MSQRCTSPTHVAAACGPTHLPTAQRTKLNVLTAGRPLPLLVTRVVVVCLLLLPSTKRLPQDCHCALCSRATLPERGKLATKPSSSATVERSTTNISSNNNMNGSTKNNKHKRRNSTATLSCRFIFNCLTLSLIAHRILQLQQRRWQRQWQKNQ